jgi:2-keto-4-pentenoate hydratase/2-oxohepta-3-ene-1,7-dioic acid hydratase in catechol pathway
MAPNKPVNSANASLTNYVAYKDPKSFGQPRIGSLDLDGNIVQPLAFASGTPLSNLYQVIEVGELQITTTGDTFLLSEVQLLPPINGRDILAVGKNYVEHAKGKK